MEWYHIKIKWWFGVGELHYTHCVIRAKSYGEALDEVLKDYGHEDIEEIKMWQDEDYDMCGFTLDEGKVEGEGDDAE